jgi:hypothetical protein
LLRRGLNNLPYFYGPCPDYIYFLGCFRIFTISVSYYLSNEASIAFHRVSHWVDPTGAIPKASCPEHGSASPNSSTKLLRVWSRLTFTANEHSTSFANQSN